MVDGQPSHSLTQQKGGTETMLLTKIRHAALLIKVVKINDILQRTSDEELLRLTKLATYDALKHPCINYNSLRRKKCQRAIRNYANKYIEHYFNLDAITFFK